MSCTFYQKRPEIWSGFCQKKARILSKQPYDSTKRALKFYQKSPSCKCQLTPDSVACMHSTKRALCSPQRGLCSAKRAVHVDVQLSNEPYITTTTHEPYLKISRDRKCSSRSVVYQKSPVFSQKSRMRSCAAIKRALYNISYIDITWPQIL